MPADFALSVGATQATPLDYAIPNAAQLGVKLMTASFDGTGAGKAFVPCVQLLFGGTNVVGSFPIGETVAAGGTADCSWFPGVGGAVAQAKSASQIDFAQITALTAFTDVETEIISGNAVTYDGITTVRIHFFSYAVECFGGHADTGIISYLWMDGADQGPWGYLDYEVGAGAPYIAGTFNCWRVLTPSAGSHTFAVYFKAQQAGDHGNVYAGVGGAGVAPPAFLEIIT